MKRNLIILIALTMSQLVICKSEQVQSLEKRVIDFIDQKSAQNPFFITELLVQFIDENKSDEFQTILKLKPEYLKQSDKQILFLLIASWLNRTEILKSLLADSSIDINQIGSEQGITALTCAVDLGHKEIVKILLADPRIQVNKPNRDGDAPIIRAAIKGMIAITKLLLAAKGIEPNIVNNNGDTALICAAREGNVKTLKALLEDRRVDRTIKNNEGKTAFDVAQDDEIKILLLQKQKKPKRGLWAAIKNIIASF